MLRSQVFVQARALANDTDSVNPFSSDSALYTFIDDWGIDLASYLKYPRAKQTISFAQGDGPTAGSIVNAKNLNQDIVSILAVFFENTTTKDVIRLKPKTENEMQNLNPQWLYPTTQALPKYYVLLDGPTEGTTDWPQVTVTIDQATSEARTMRIHYIQAPAASTTATNTLIFPPQYHKSCVYYVAAQMMLPRNAQKADLFMKMYLDERRKAKSLAPEQLDPATEIWDFYQIPGYPQANVLIR